MSLLKSKIDNELNPHRVFPVTTKLTKQERQRITEFARAKGISRGEWMRTVALRQIEEADAQTPVNKVLTEIVGVQLLLMNVLKPIVTGQPMTVETFDQIVQQIHHAKREIAGRIVQEGV